MNLPAVVPCLASTALIGGCATPAQVRTAPGANVADYKTCNFVSPLGTDRAGYSSFLSSSLKSVTRSALEAKGYTDSESDAQMAVNFSGQAQRKTDVALRRDGEPATAAAELNLAANKTAEGQIAFTSAAVEVSAAVESVDAAHRKVTLRLPDGSQKSIKIHRNVDVVAVAAGDTVVVAIAEQLVIAASPK